MLKAWTPAEIPAFRIPATDPSLGAGRHFPLAGIGEDPIAKSAEAPMSKDLTSGWGGVQMCLKMRVLIGLGAQGCALVWNPGVVLSSFGETVVIRLEQTRFSPFLNHRGLPPAQPFNGPQGGSCWRQPANLNSPSGGSMKKQTAVGVLLVAAVLGAAAQVAPVSTTILGRERHATTMQAKRGPDCQDK